MLIDKVSVSKKFKVRGPRQKLLTGSRPNSTPIHLTFDMKLEPGPKKGQWILFGHEQEAREAGGAGGARAARGKRGSGGNRSLEVVMLSSEEGSSIEGDRDG